MCAWKRLSEPVPLHAAGAAPRFDAASAGVIEGPDDLLSLQPAFLRSLSRELDVEALAARICPVLLADHTVAILALAEHVGGDQADALAARVLGHGYALAVPQRYVLAAPLLLAIARNQVTVRTLAGRRGALSGRSGTALSDAFQDMVEWGVRQGASDLHVNILAREPESEVRFTLAGRYVAPERFQRIPTSTLLDMLAVVWMDIRGGNGAVFDPCAEQQGSLTRQVDGKPVLLRWASLAAERGPSVCLRLLRRDAHCAGLSLEQLGYLPHQAAAIEGAMRAAGGAIVFSGAVGSGKSTTLAALISRIPAERKVVTIEDPVEYLIPNAIQNTVVRALHETAHDDYAAKLRTLKRSAMNDVLLGEIRDRETGRAFMDLAGSGVSVYTTVHAPCAALVGERLASDFIGVSRDFLATPGMLKLLVHQVLLPVLCPHCALPPRSWPRDVHDAAWLKALRRLYPCEPDPLRLRNPAGCGACRLAQAAQVAGYAGRTVAAEYIEPACQPRLLDGIRRADTSWLRETQAPPFPGVQAPERLRSALHCAMYKVLSGRIDPRDIETGFLPFVAQARLAGAGATASLERAA